MLDQQGFGLGFFFDSDFCCTTQRLVEKGLHTNAKFFFHGFEECID